MIPGTISRIWQQELTVILFELAVLAVAVVLGF
jgi:hypothetical protein